MSGDYVCEGYGGFSDSVADLGGCEGGGGEGGVGKGEGGGAVRYETRVFIWV